MNITDPTMAKKLSRALKEGGDLHTLEDIATALTCGEMQSHVEGETWAITQVQVYPRKKVVYIWYIIGVQMDIGDLEDKITAWAKDIGARSITSIGRGGWWKLKTPGWKMAGIVYSKDI